MRDHPYGGYERFRKAVAESPTRAARVFLPSVLDKVV
jgi:hypothetical protein